MKRRFRLRGRQRRFLIVLLLLSAGGYISVQFSPLGLAPSLLQESSSRTSVVKALEPSPSETQEKLDPAQGLKVYVDPETGQFRRPPAGAIFDEAPPPVADDMARKSVTDEPLEFMSPMAGGGVVTKVRLRFRRPLMATKDADGNLIVQHVPQDTDLREQR